MFVFFLDNQTHNMKPMAYFSQGSESNTVVYYVGESKLQNWKHVYTAVTRGRKSVFILGKQLHLKDACWAKDKKRRSRLQRRLKDAMKVVDFQVGFCVCCFSISKAPIGHSEID